MLAWIKPHRHKHRSATAVKTKLVTAGEAQAATTLQRAFTGLLDSRSLLDRRLLLDRLHLERKVTLPHALSDHTIRSTEVLTLSERSALPHSTQVLDGWLNFVNSLLLFMLIAIVLLIEQRASEKFGVLTSLKRTLGLERLADIRTAAEFNDYIYFASERGRSMQPLSSNYFDDEHGTIKLIKGEPAKLGASGMLRMAADPRILTNFSISAWTRVAQPGGSGYIVRKPLSTQPSERALNCWAWHTGTTPHFAFGAHDFRGSKSDSSVQEEVIYAVNGTDSVTTSWNDGQLHLEVVVIIGDELHFYQDGVLRSNATLPRPVTDCAGSTLELGGPGLLLGELTFYAQVLSPTDISDILNLGFTLGSIATGRLPFMVNANHLETSDDSSIQRDATANAERNDLRTEIQIEGVLSRAGTAVQASFPVIDVPRAEPGCSATTLRCHVIYRINETLTLGAGSSRPYYPLLATVAQVIRPVPTHSRLRVTAPGRLPRCPALPTPFRLPVAVDYWRYEGARRLRWRCIRVDDPLPQF